MGKRILGTILGFLASWAGIILWIILGAIGFIAGLAGAVMGILFSTVYRAINPSDKSGYRYVLAAVVMVVDIVLAEFILQQVYLALFGEYDLIWFVADIVIGLILSGMSLGSHIGSEKRKERIKADMTTQQQYAIQPQQADPFSEFNQPAAPDSPTANETAAEQAVADTAQNEAPMPAPSVELKKRKITVMRKKQFSCALLPLYLYCDSKMIAVIKNGETFTFEVTTQQHGIQIGWTEAVMLSEETRYSNGLLTDTEENDLYVQINQKMGLTHNTFEIAFVEKPNEKK